MLSIDCIGEELNYFELFSGFGKVRNLFFKKLECLFFLKCMLGIGVR